MYRRACQCCNDDRDAAAAAAAAADDDDDDDINDNDNIIAPFNRIAGIAAVSLAAGVEMLKR